jgi:hypothetical protein
MTANGEINMKRIMGRSSSIHRNLMEVIGHIESGHVEWGVLLGQYEVLLSNLKMLLEELAAPQFQHILVRSTVAKNMITHITDRLSTNLCLDLQMLHKCVSSESSELLYGKRNVNSFCEMARNLVSMFEEMEEAFQDDQFEREPPLKPKRAEPRVSVQDYLGLVDYGHGLRQ